MKKIIFPAFISLFFFTSQDIHCQGLINKLKNKASQEVNKIEQSNLNPQRSANASNKNKLSSNVTRSIALTLKSDENFDYSENCIDLNESSGQVSLIVTQRAGSTTQCYSYRNGTKTPVSCSQVTNGNNNCQAALQCSYNKLRSIDLDGDEAKQFIFNETESHDMAQPAISDQQMKTMEAYMTKEQIDAMKKQLAEAQKQTAGKTYSTVKSRTIKFNGKSYGPYKQLAQFYLTADGKNFYAVYSEPDQSPTAPFKIISSTISSAIAVPGFTAPTQCIAANDNSEFSVFNINTDGKYQVFTSKGKTFTIEPTAINSVWYSPNNHLMMISNDKLLQEGNVIKTFEPNSYYDPCDLFFSSDGKGVTIVKNNAISFADGDYYEYPLKISLVKENGKNYFKWLALENREVVIYRKPY